jgi:hydrogenase maturation protease
MAEPLRVLVSAVGNVLKQDDGFGIAVGEALHAVSLPPGVKLIESSIAGIHMVQELTTGYDVLIMIDAVERGGVPGQLYWLEAEVPDITTYTFDQRNEILADMHFTNPTRAMMLAKGVGVLPARTYILGCQAAQHSEFEMGLSPAVAAAVPRAVAMLIDRLENPDKMG